MPLDGDSKSVNDGDGGACGGGVNSDADCGDEALDDDDGDSPSMLGPKRSVLRYSERSVVLYSASERDGDNGASTSMVEA